MIGKLKLITAGTPTEQDRLVSPSVAAEILGVGKTTIERMVKRGELKPVRVTARRIGFSLRALNHLVAHGAQK